MNDSSSLVKSEVYQNLSGGYREAESVITFWDWEEEDVESHTEEFTKYSKKNLPADYQFFIFILLFKPQSSFYRCVGSLLRSNWILTAASCITVRQIVPPDVRCVQTTDDFIDFFKLSHQESLNDTVEHPNFEERSIIDLLLHPEFDPEMGYYDLALIKLNKEFTRNVTIPVAEDQFNLPRANCWVIGLLFENSNLYDIEAVIKTVNNVTISVNDIVYTSKTGKTKKATQPIMRGVYSYKSVCQGELGVPLVCNGQLVGVGTIPDMLNRDILTRQPVSILLNSCEVRNEYYFNYLIYSVDWIKNIINGKPKYINGCISNFFNTNWLLIALPLLSVS